MAVRHRFLALPSQRAQRSLAGRPPVPAIVFGVTYGLRRFDGQTVEVCDECGFDAREVPDVPSSLQASCALRTGGGNHAGDRGQHEHHHRRPSTASYSEFDTLQTSRGRVTGAIGDGSGGRLEAHTGGGAIRIVR